MLTVFTDIGSDIQFLTLLTDIVYSLLTLLNDFVNGLLTLYTQFTDIIYRHCLLTMF